MPCLDENQLLDLVEGRLLADEEERAKRHVDDCEDCRELLAATAKSMFSQAPDLDTDETVRLSRGQNIGRYVILDVIGAGGMGVVYGAYDPELDRKVALKLLRRDLVDDKTKPAVRAEASVGDLQKRLLREAQAMAKLSHPNVVTVFDAGTTQGRVFLAMEFVDGQSLTDWLAEKPRSWTHVLSVYDLAGRGLGAAHRAGLVHRDFKPDNVLVAADGQVRVTDFGLACAVDRPENSPRKSERKLGTRTAEISALTQPGAIAGTPAYMAPEQFLGHPADHGTDQFNFSVALYESLYGQRPFAGKTVAELQKQVISGRIRPTPKDTTVPARVHRALLRGLSLNRADRYPSMDAMLTALAVGSWKVRRRILIPAAVALIAIAGLLGYRAPKNQNLVCTGAERKLVGIWDVERKSIIQRAFMASAKPYAADAWQSTERILDAYTSSWVNMHTEACKATHVHREQSEELLDRRIACLDSNLRQAAALTKLFAEADVSVVERAVEASQSLPRMSDCADVSALKAAVRPPKDPITAAKVEEARLTLARVKALEKAGKYADALALGERTLTEARALSYAPLEAEALLQVGRAAGRLEDPQRAESALQEAADLAGPSGHHEVAARAWIALIYFIGNKQAKYDQALKWSRFAEAEIERLGERDGEIEADRLETVSIIYWKLSQNDEALRALERALTLYRKHLGPDHISVARTLDGIAAAYGDQGKLESALDLDRQALAIAERALGPNHPSLTLFLNNTGNAWMVLGRYDEALTMLRRGLDIAEKTLGKEQPGTISLLNTVGQVLMSLGRYDEALPHLELARRISDRSGRQETPDYAVLLEDIGEIARLRGKTDEALSLDRQALGILEKVLGGDHPEVGMCLSRTARMLTAQGKTKEASVLFDKAIAIVSKGAGEDSPITAAVLLTTGQARVASGDATGAAPLLERALQFHTTHPGDPRDLADVKFALATAAWASPTSRGRALTLAHEARAIYSGAPHFKSRLDAVDAWLAGHAL